MARRTSTTIMETMKQWIEKQNDKKEKCTFNNALCVQGHYRGGGTDGYNHWSVKCQNGILVYEDTTVENHKMEADWQARKDVLISAARSRVLTDKESKNLLAEGPNIFVKIGQCLLPEGYRRIF